MAERSTERRHTLSNGLHAVAAEEVLSRILVGQTHALAALPAAFDAITLAASAGAQALRHGGKMAYAGAGSSGLMALADCLELPGTFGIAPDRVPMLFAGGVEALLHMQGAPEDDPNLAQADLDRAQLSKGDVVLCLAASGATPYTLTVAKLAQARGVTVVGFSNVASSPLLQLADMPVLLDTGPEIVSGSTRMGAGTVQKVALNMLSVLVAIDLGHVHDGYMVNVTADNAKLVDRASRIVADVSGTGIDGARAALILTDGAVKSAILVARGLTPQQAQDALAESGGHLAPLLT
ncbi:MAG: N-acetylmuramic acid 6-phosphate etherase [Pseudotabrizicola sp.]|uniref:N-acetylmuramic acid 6-phosphate etherase n=1 Tax=Pseudotabrizicola sp. TaxID=2939647 RepID=UPI00273032B6|nr:N-acetylmuramic acid 6-phosphate etherase [Pseudotabrizicola sp.]MDP2081212.1 N-acetylmuramic acid 6-phosphate etherase [Pseudotabrizicola sp.]MDZ7576169.1 N-acetylmuramic acid 6-phosphate etherase [Pseudotabrizicola sp.]